MRVNIHSVRSQTDFHPTRKVGEMKKEEGRMKKGKRENREIRQIRESSVSFAYLAVKYFLGEDLDEPQNLDKTGQNAKMDA
jgi:hypothetical protein